ncbi:aspartic proteinase-like protein 2 [Phtheirospermum japonicum]|uniref:Aspartic proteinase-like protein 2 n=1 Tax=Phtheirospermum japonicum TaxID=374723 RepID=A0A830CYZ8_9LAMI|nr:aspartic proteinase-like protein 2 [Phtheirospermum japonicum]
MESRFHSLMILLSLLNLLILNRAHKTGGDGVIKVNYKFAGAEPSLSALRAHDDVRHLAVFAGVDLPLGGTGRPDAVGATNAPEEVTVEYDPHLYVATYFEYWDEIELTLYNPRESLTGKIVSCNQDFCKEIGGGLRGCAANSSCLYTEVYGDGSYSMGYFVEDVVQYDRVSGDLQTKSANGSVIFGCGAGQSGDLRQSDDALDGILGFGKSNSSMLSQLASAGRVKKMFAHCLDGVNGGGIFAIGHVVQPLVNTTPLVPGQKPNRSRKRSEANMHRRKPGAVGKLYSGNLSIGRCCKVYRQHPDLIFVLGVLYKYWIKRVLQSTPLELATSLSYLSHLRIPLPGSAPRPVGYRLSHCTAIVFPNTLCPHSCAPQPRDFYSKLSTHNFEVLMRGLAEKKEELMCIGWQNSGIETQDKKNITLLGGEFRIDSVKMVTFIDDSSQSKSEIFCVHYLKMKKALVINTMPYTNIGPVNRQSYININVLKNGRGVRLEARLGTFLEKSSRGGRIRSPDQKRPPQSVVAYALRRLRRTPQTDLLRSNQTQFVLINNNMAVASCVHGTLGWQTKQPDYHSKVEPVEEQAKKNPFT